MFEELLRAIGKLIDRLIEKSESKDKNEDQ